LRTWCGLSCRISPRIERGGPGVPGGPRTAEKAHVQPHGVPESGTVAVSTAVRSATWQSACALSLAFRRHRTSSPGLPSRCGMDAAWRPSPRPISSSTFLSAYPLGRHAAAETRGPEQLASPVVLEVPERHPMRLARTDQNNAALSQVAVPGHGKHEHPSRRERRPVRGSHGLWAGKLSAGRSGRLQPDGGQVRNLRPGELVHVWRCSETLPGSGHFV
jgi:hypothetical protein